MKTNFKINRKEIILTISTLIAGFIIAWLVFHKSGQERITEQMHSNEVENESHDAKETIWTCSMHPQIRQHEPGQCPLCGMDLIPVKTEHSNEMNVSENEISFSEAAIKLSDIQTTIVTKSNPEMTLELFGKIKADERNISQFTARFSGRIETLYVNFTGQKILKGQKAASIYSPELINAQKELIEAYKFADTNPELYLSAVNKLKLWNITGNQINEIIEKGEPYVNFDILSPASGIVNHLNVSKGNYVKEGTELFEIIDLNNVWVKFEAYESDLPWISEGDEVHFTVSSIPGQKFNGKVSYIDPYINAETRIAEIRVNMVNPDMKLKPGMFTKGILNSQIAAETKELLVPESSVLWTGKKAVVYVRVPNQESSRFGYREVSLGPKAGDFYIIKEGLEEGEEIVLNGVFKVDASAQLAGKKSMMNADDMKASSGHNHGETGILTTEKTEDKHMGFHEETFRVSGLCGMCKTRIEETALALDGVKFAEWDEKTTMFHVSFDPAKLKLRDIHKALAKVGHDTDLEKASQLVYDNLPACCKYPRN